MMVGHAAGTVAALAAKGETSVQQVDPAKLNAALRSEHAILDIPHHPPHPHPSPSPPPPSPDPHSFKYVCEDARCVGYPPGGAGRLNSTCGGACSPFAANEWIGSATYWKITDAGIVCKHDTFLKKTMVHSWAGAPPSLQKTTPAGTKFALVKPVQLLTGTTGFFIATIEPANL